MGDIVKGWKGSNKRHSLSRRNIRSINGFTETEPSSNKLLIGFVQEAPKEGKIEYTDPRMKMAQQIAGKALKGIILALQADAKKLNDKEFTKAKAEKKAKQLQKTVDMMEKLKFKEKDIQKMQDLTNKVNNAVSNEDLIKANKDALTFFTSVQEIRGE